MVVAVERGKYKRKMGNMMNYFVFSEHQVFTPRVEIFISWNGGERKESKAQIKRSLL